MSLDIFIQSLCFIPLNIHFLLCTLRKINGIGLTHFVKQLNHCWICVCIISLHYNLYDLEYIFLITHIRYHFISSIESNENIMILPGFCVILLCLISLCFTRISLQLFLDVKRVFSILGKAENHSTRKLFLTWNLELSYF